MLGVVVPMGLRRAGMRGCSRDLRRADGVAGCVGAAVVCVSAGDGRRFVGMGEAVLEVQAVAVNKIRQTPMDREDRIVDYSSGTTVTVAESVLVTHSSWSRISIRRGL